MSAASQTLIDPCLIGNWRQADETNATACHAYQQAEGTWIAAGKKRDKSFVARWKAKHKAEDAVNCLMVAHGDLVGSALQSAKIVADPWDYDIEKRPVSLRLRPRNGPVIEIATNGAVTIELEAKP
jgi:hypothetical protein